MSSSATSTPPGSSVLPLGSSPLERLGPVLVVLGDLHVGAEGVDLLGAEVLAEALVDPAGEDLGRALVIGLEEILAERVIGVSLPHEDALQLGVSGEADAHHVVDFALLEVGPAIDLVERRDHALPLGLVGADPQLDQRRRAWSVLSSW